MKTRTPAKHNTRRVPGKVATYSKALKNMHRRYRKGGGELSLKQFVKTSEDENIQLLGVDWLHNKTANFSNPPLGIGSTRKKKNKQGQRVAPVKAIA